MKSLHDALKDYLHIRRSLGYKLFTHGGLLDKFVGFLESAHASFVTTPLAIEWAQLNPDVQLAQWAYRLSVARQFALYCSALDPRTEVPPLHILPYRPERKAPYIYSDQEIKKIVVGARRLGPREGLRAWTHTTLFGLMAATGIRVGEAIALKRNDVDLIRGQITIHGAKHGKSRLLPVHGSTAKALQRYTLRRNQVLPIPRSPYFFLNQRGGGLDAGTLRCTFRELSQKIGLRGHHARKGPRMHDIRHTFAVKTLVNWYRAGVVDVDARLPQLSTYLGHTHVADTYWYLSASPELLTLAGARAESHLEATHDER